MPRTKTISFPESDQDLFEWLSKQPNQSETIRDALRLLKKRLEAGEPADLDIVRQDLAEIKRAINALHTLGIAVPQEVEEDQSAVSILLDTFGDDA